MAKPNAKEEYIEKIDPPSPHGFGRAREARFIVAVKEPPVQGRANAAIIKALAGHFDVPISRVRIVSGHTSRQKIIEIEQFLE